MNILQYRVNICHLVKIGRILLAGEERYCVIKGNEMFDTDISRDSLGIESMFEKTPHRGGLIAEINDDITWLPPVARPGKIICVGRNYRAHASEQGREPEDKPLLFSKYSSSMVGHHARVRYPTHTSNLDYEVELAVVMGSHASRLTADDNPLDHVFGYTVANDLTARDVQKSEKQWTRGKAFDQSLVIGPYIKTREVVGDGDHDIWLFVNGEKRQLSNTSLMLFDISFLIRYISQTISLEPGDILLTGTPAGVGYYMEPRAVLNRGDMVRCGVTDVAELGFTIV